MIELRKRIGNKAVDGRSVQVRSPLDDVYDVVDGKPYLVGMCLRKPLGSPLCLVSTISESQIADTLKLLDERDGQEYPDRRVGDPPHPIDDTEGSEPDE